MGLLRFRKRIKIAPGLHINIGERGVSASVGRPGATVNIGQRGVRTTVGLPGTGISYTSTARPAVAPTQPGAGVPRASVMTSAIRAFLAFFGWAIAVQTVLILAWTLTSHTPPPSWLTWCGMAAGAYGARRSWRRNQGVVPNSTQD